MKFKSDIETQAGLVDSFGFAGTPGQVLSSTGNKTEWITPPQSPGGGGASQVFYFNGGTASSVGGYYQMSPVANTGAAADFTINANGYIASFLTDVASPNQLNIPAGNWNFEVYFSASSSGNSPSFYVELYKYSSGGVFTLIASSSAAPEGITNGTAIDAYFTPLAVPATTLLATDRLAVRIYVTHSGRTITMHTQNGHLSEVITTFSTGLTALNGLTEQVQYFAVGAGGTDFNIASATNTHTFNLPTASATNRGALSSANWTTFNNKVGGTGTSGQVAYWNGTSSITGESNLFWDSTNGRLGIGTASPQSILEISQASPIFRIQASDAATLHGIEFRQGAGLDAFIKSLPSAGEFRIASGRSSGWGGTTTFYTDTFERMRISSSGFVGIGTTTPNQRLTLVNGTFQIGGGDSTFSGNIEIGRVGGDNMVFATGGSEKVRITSSGNVLIGTTTDVDYKLDVNGTGRFNQNLTLNRASSGNATGLVYQTASTNNWYIGSSAIGANTDLQVYNHSATAVVFHIANTTGNVGIGTTSPLTKLHIQGDESSTTDETLLTLSGNGENGKRIDFRNAFGSLARITGTKLSGGGGADEGILTFETATNSVLSEKMRITSSGNVGIGTTSPTRKLSVLGGTDGGIYVLSNSGSTTLPNDGLSLTTGFNVSYLSSRSLGVGGGIADLAYSAKDHVFDNGFTERMRITSGGNVLIGTTTDAGYKLDVNGTIRAAQSITIGTGGSYTSGSIFSNVDWGMIFRAKQAAPTQAQFMWADSADSELMRIKDGNLAIGTTTPLLTNSNRGSVTINGSLSSILTLGTAGSYSGYLYSDSTKLELSSSTQPLTIVTNGSERMRITSGGNVGIGVSSPMSYSGYNTLTIGGNTNGGVLAVRNASGFGLNLYADNAGGRIGAIDSTKALFFDTSDTERMRISHTGNVIIANLGTGLVYSNSGALTSTNPSDERLKDDITDLQYGLNEILQLRPVTYNWKNDAINQGKQFGFIAQEVQEIMPDLVKEFETKDGDDDVIRLGLDKEAIFVAMVNAIKELKAEIEILKNK